MSNHFKFWRSFLVWYECSRRIRSQNVYGDLFNLKVAKTPDSDLALTGKEEELVITTNGDTKTY